MPRAEMTWDELLLAELHKAVGRCGHCGKKKCPMRSSWSELPPTIPTSAVIEAIRKSGGDV
jgi:hypothetical protein